MLNRVGEVLESHGVDVAAVVETGDEIEADVLLPIGDDSDYAGDLPLDEVVHNLADNRRAGRIHEFQAAKVGEEAEARFDLGQKFLHPFEAGLHLACVDSTEVVQGEPSSGSIGVDEKHKSGKHDTGDGPLREAFEGL